MTFNKETKVGAMALAALLVAYFGIGFLQKRSYFSDSHLYSTVYPSGRGVTSSSPVLLKGIEVGHVRTVDILPQQDYKVLVTFEVRKDVVLTQSSKANLITLSPLFDKKGIELLLDTTGAPLKSGSQVCGEVAQSLQETLIKEASPTVQNMHKISEHLSRLTKALSDSTTCIQSTLKNMHACTAHLDQMLSTNHTGIAAINHNLVEVSAALADKRQGIGAVLAKLNEVVSAVDVEDVAHLHASVQTLHTLLERLDDGQGTLGRLIRDDTLHKRLCNTVTDLGHLLNDVRVRPWRYVHFSMFGKRYRPTEPTVTK